jgi:hypothetical protein
MAVVDEHYRPIWGIDLLFIAASIVPKKRVSINRQQSERQDYENSHHCCRHGFADYSPSLAMFGYGRSRRTTIDGNHLAGNVSAKHWKHLAMMDDLWNNKLSYSELQ